MHVARSLLLRAVLLLAGANVLHGCSPRPDAIAPAPASSAPPSKPSTFDATNGCRGASFDADDASGTCAVPSERPRLPPRDALRVRLVEKAVVRTGETATFTLEMKNATSSAVSFDIDSSCFAWETIATRGDLSTFESECGGLCGRLPTMLRYTLDPGGIVVKHVRLAATRRRVSGDKCEEKNLGPLPAGAYTMTVTLPWFDPAPTPEHPNDTNARVFTTQLSVTP